MKDTRFFLTTFFYNQEQNKDDFKSIQRLIESNGHLIMKVGSDTMKIYRTELAIIFSSKEFPARNLDTQDETKINGWEYLQTYVKAYKEGEQYFETEFKVSPNTLYGANAEQYVRDIHLNFFHIQHGGANEGWSYVKKGYPFIITHKTIKDFGYYSGIVNKVEEQVNKYPRLFATFDKCEHNLPPPQTEAKTHKIQAPVLGLFCSLINSIGIDKREEAESTSVYCERICSKYELPYSDRVRQNYNVNETKKLIKQLSENILPLIDAKTKSAIQKYLDSKHPTKENLYG
jgi:hypothetical protein